MGDEILMAMQQAAQWGLHSIFSGIKVLQNYNSFAIFSPPNQFL
jgi:hypothetical protein